MRGLVRHRITLTRDMTRVKNRIHAILDKYELEFTGTGMQKFGKAGMMWLWSITSKLTELDQFIYMINRKDEYRFSTDLFKTKKLKKLEGESKKWAKMMEVPAGGMTA